MNSVLPPATSSSDIVEIDGMCWLPSIPGKIMGSGVVQPPWPPPQITTIWLSCKGIYAGEKIELKPWPGELLHHYSGVVHPWPPLRGFVGNLPLDELQKIFGSAGCFTFQRCSMNGPRGTTLAAPESQILQLLCNLSSSNGCVTGKDQCHASVKWCCDILLSRAKEWTPDVRSVQHAGAISYGPLWHEHHTTEITWQVLVNGSVLTLFLGGPQHNFHVAELLEGGSQLKCMWLTPCLGGELLVEVAISQNIGARYFLEMYDQEEQFCCFGTGSVQPRRRFPVGTECRNFPGSNLHGASKHLAIVLGLGFGGKPNSDGFRTIQDGIEGASDLHLYAEKQPGQAGELSVEGTKSCTDCTLINYFLLEEAEYCWIPPSNVENGTCVEVDLNFYLETLALVRKRWKTNQHNSCWVVRSTMAQWYYLWYLDFCNQEKVVSCSYIDLPSDLLPTLIDQLLKCYPVSRRTSEFQEVRFEFLIQEDQYYVGRQQARGALEQIMGWRRRGRRCIPSMQANVTTMLMEYNKLNTLVCAIFSAPWDPGDVFLQHASNSSRSFVAPGPMSQNSERIAAPDVPILDRELHAQWDPRGHAQVFDDGGLRASRMLRRGECHGPYGPLDLAVMGCYDQKGRPKELQPIVFVYKYRGGGDELGIDGNGGTTLFSPRTSASLLTLYL